MAKKTEFKYEMTVHVKAKKYGIWHAKDGGSSTVTTFENFKQWSDRDDLVLWKSFYAHSWEIAMGIANYLLKREPYRPMDWDAIEKQRQGVQRDKSNRRKADSRRSHPGTRSRT